MAHHRPLLAFTLCLLTAPLFPAAAATGEARVDALLRQMTLDEKLGQLTLYSGGTATGPETGRRAYEAMVAAGEVGAFLNVVGPDVNRLQKIALEDSRLKIPLIFALDVIHGYRTIFPTPLGLSATWSPDLVERSARIAALEARADGLRWTFAPMVDIARDARWGRITEGAGEDPYLGRVMAAAYVRGFQGRALGGPHSIAATLKHYVGYGAAEGGRDYNTTQIPERLLREVYLPPFRAGVEAGAATVMTGFNALNGVPASANDFILRRILRQEWGFEGLVVSDWTSIAEIEAHGTARDGGDAARKAITAGVDMDMESDLYRTRLGAEIAAGRVALSVIDEAVRRVLRLKMAVGLFDEPYAELDPDAMVQPGFREVAREAAERSFVLLKNDGVLPLKPDAKVALIGPLAEDAGAMLGSWGARGRPGDVVTLRAALAHRLGGGLIYARGTGIDTRSDDGFAEAVAAARQSDIAILALGEDAGRMTGEAASRTRLDLPGNQTALLKAVAETGVPIVLLVFSGRPLDLTDVAPDVEAMLAVWYPGIEAGPALSRVLYGDSSPGGRLTVSFPRAVGQEPLYYNRLSTGRPVPPEDRSGGGEPLPKYVSRYIDEEDTALYPFGYGLSYTRFSYGPVSVEHDRYSARALNAGKTRIRVRGEVTNVGERPGEEVVQLYIRQRGTSVARPVRELKGFQRVALRPGETREVEFSLGRDELAFWTIDMEHLVEPADLQVWIAGSSTDGQPATTLIGD